MTGYRTLLVDRIDDPAKSVRPTVNSWRILLELEKAGAVRLARRHRYMLVFPDHEPTHDDYHLLMPIIRNDDLSAMTSTYYTPAP